MEEDSEYMLLACLNMKAMRVRKSLEYCSVFLALYTAHANSDATVRTTVSPINRPTSSSFELSSKSLVPRPVKISRIVNALLIAILVKVVTAYERNVLWNFFDAATATHRRFVVLLHSCRLQSCAVSQLTHGTHHTLTYTTFHIAWPCMFYCRDAI